MNFQNCFRNVWKENQSLRIQMIELWFIHYARRISGKNAILPVIWYEIVNLKLMGFQMQVDLRKLTDSRKQKSKKLIGESEDVKCSCHENYLIFAIIINHQVYQKSV